MKNIALVYGTFHQNYVNQMVEAVRAEAKKRGLTITHEIPVPGSMEKPLAVKRLLLKDDVDGVIVLGIIEKGETKHGLVMAQSVISALIQLQLDLMKPLGVAILGPEIQPSQIPARVVPYALSALDALCVMLKLK